MEFYAKRIHQLIASQQPSNNTLAAQLLQSQLGWTRKEAWLYLLDYQVNAVWTTLKGKYSFEVSGYEVSFCIQEEDEIYNFLAYLVCRIERGEECWEQKKYLGSFEYEFTFGSAAPPSPNLLDCHPYMAPLLEQVLDQFHDK